jgi:hypothetical protein
MQLKYKAPQWYEINKQEQTISYLTFLTFRTALQQNQIKSKTHNDNTNRHFKIEEASLLLIYD